MNWDETGSKESFTFQPHKGNRDEEESRYRPQSGERTKWYSPQVAHRDYLRTPESKTRNRHQSPTYLLLSGIDLWIVWNHGKNGS